MPTESTEPQFPSRTPVELIDELRRNPVQREAAIALTIQSQQLQEITDHVGELLEELDKLTNIDHARRLLTAEQIARLRGEHHLLPVSALNALASKPLKNVRLWYDTHSF